MKEKRLYIIDIDDIPEDTGIDVITDDEFVEIAERRGTVYTFEGFVDGWLSESLGYPENCFCRILEVPKQIVGYQVLEDGIASLMYDWWIFKTKSDADKYIEWQELDKSTVEPVYDGDIEEPKIITFEDYIFVVYTEDYGKDSFIDDGEYDSADEISTPLEMIEAQFDVDCLYGKCAINRKEVLHRIANYFGF